MQVLRNTDTEAGGAWLEVDLRSLLVTTSDWGAGSDVDTASFVGVGDYGSNATFLCADGVCGPVP